METPKRKNKNRFALIFFIVAVLLLIITCIGTCVSSDAPTGGIDSIHVQALAKIKAEDAVKTLLKSPRSANFISSDQKFWLLPDSTVVVKGSVDADNSFGSSTRNNYYVKLKWSFDKNNNEVWKLIDINIE